MSGKAGNRTGQIAEIERLSAEESLHRLLTDEDFLNSNSRHVTPVYTLVCNVVKNVETLKKLIQALVDSRKSSTPDKLEIIERYVARVVATNFETIRHSDKKILRALSKLISSSPETGFFLIANFSNCISKTALKAARRAVIKSPDYAAWVILSPELRSNLSAGDFKNFAMAAARCPTRALDVLLKVPKLPKEVKIFAELSALIRHSDTLLDRNFKKSLEKPAEFAAKLLQLGFSPKRAVQAAAKKFNLDLAKTN